MKKDNNIFFEWFLRKIASGRDFMTVSPKVAQHLPCNCHIEEESTADVRWIKGKGYFHVGKNSCGRLLVMEEKFVGNISPEKVMKREQKFTFVRSHTRNTYFNDCPGHC